MSTIKQRIEDDLKTAMRARQKDEVATLRFIMAAIKQREVDERIELDDQQLIALLDKMARQRKEAHDQYKDAGREDLANKEANDLTVTQRYLPQPLSTEEVQQLITQAITDTGAESMKDMGKVMAQLKPQIQGRADGAAVSKIVKEKLAG